MQGVALLHLSVNKSEQFLIVQAPEKKSCTKKGKRAIKSDSFELRNPLRMISYPCSVMVLKRFAGAGVLFETVDLDQAISFRTFQSSVNLCLIRGPEIRCRHIE